ALTFTKAYTTPEVEAAASRTLELCRQVDETPQLIQAIMGTWGFYIFRAEYQTVRELAERLISLAQRTHDSAALLVAHRMLAEILYHSGEMVSARTHFKHALALYDPQQCRALIARFGFDPAVNGLALLAHLLGLLGYPDQAQTRSRAALTLVQEIAHPLTTALVWGWDILLHQVLREAQAVRQRAEAVIALFREQGFSAYSGILWRGWALAMQGQTDDGLNQIHQGLAFDRAAGIELLRPYYLGLLAEAYSK